MITAIVSTISDIVINVLSSVIYDKGKNLLESQHAEQIKVRIRKWTEGFFSKHMEMVFESSQFNNYVKYQKPFDKIRDYVFETDNSVIIEQEFLKGITTDCKRHIIEADGKCSTFEESTICDLFSGVLTLYKNILSEKTSDGEKLILYHNRQNSAKIDVEFNKLTSKIEDLASQIKQGDKITDPEIIEKAYKHFSDAIWAGKIVDVHALLPMLSGKNDDLENAIKIKLAILSDYNMFITDPLVLCHSICNPVLKDDVFRLLILNNFATPDRLSPYVESISNPTLKVIATSIVTEHIDEIITIESKIQNNITCFSYKFADGMETESWLIRRLCALKITSFPICNLSKTISTLVVQPNFVDQLYIWEYYLNETVSFDIGEKRSKSKEFLDYVVRVKKSVDNYINAQFDLQRRFYLVLTRAMLLAEDADIKDTLANIPDKIAKLPEFEALRLDRKIDEGNVDSNDIVGFVLQTKQYWLLVHYCESLDNSQAALDIINQTSWLIGQSPEIFDYTVTATCHAKSKKDAINLLKEYEKTYSDYPEFWVKAYGLAETDTDRQWATNSIVLKMQNGGFIYGSIRAKARLSSILIKEKCFTEAIDILTTIEQMDSRNLNITRKKIEAYVNSGRQIDALTEINKHYGELKNDTQILDLLLTISLTNERPIDKEILSQAKIFSNSRILMLAAEAEYIKKNTNEAKKLAMRSMLISKLDTEELFDTAIKYFLEDDSSDNKAPNRITENTFFVAENQQDHTCLTFCIYKEEILPKTEYQWKDAQHIYINDAVNMNFMRLLVGDTVNIKGAMYKIIKIAPIEAFYVNVCMNSMIQRNKALTISGNSVEEMLQGIVAAYNQHPNWNKQDWNQRYSDFSKSAFPIYMIKSQTNLEYGQLMRTIMDDPSVIVREYVFPIRDYKSREYIITYTALVELYKLGINPAEFYSNIVIPSSVVSEAKREADVIYQHNNRDLVASMDVREDKVRIIESTENAKRENAHQAIDFMKYVSVFTSVVNTQDVVITELHNQNITRIIGICDYDSVILANTRKSVLVTGEMMVAGFTKIDATKADVAGISDFLCLIGIPVMKLFSAIRQMFKYRFYAAITPTVIAYISKAYDTGDEIKKTAIEKEWNNILKIPESLADENYFSKFKIECLEIIPLLKESNIDLSNPILRAFNLATFYYNDYRLEYHKENGKLCCMVVKIDKEKTDINSSEKNEN